MPHREENGSNNAKRSGAFASKSKRNDEVKEVAKNKQNAMSGKIKERRRTRRKPKSSRFSQDRKSSKLKSLGRKRLRLDSQRTATADRVKDFGTFAFSKKCGSVFELRGRLGCRKYQKCPIYKENIGAVIGFKTKIR